MEDENVATPVAPRAKATPEFRVLRRAKEDELSDDLAGMLANGELWIEETGETPHVASSQKAAIRHFAGEDGEGEFVAIPDAHFKPKRRKIGEEPVKPKVTEIWE